MNEDYYYTAYDEWQQDRRSIEEQEQYNKLVQEIVNKSMYYGSRSSTIVETVVKTTEVRTVVYTFPELDLD